MQILYEDNHLIAVQKPHGLLTQGDDSGDPSLMDEVKELIRVRDHKPGAAFLGLIHRLDRPVGGVVLFAKTSKGASRLSEQFRARTVEKTYWCVVETAHRDPVCFSEGGVTQWLVKDEERNFVTAYDHEVPGSLKAELAYRTVSERDGLALVEVKPRTGRPHQIRVAMATLGMPIVGDRKYGAEMSLDRDIALFAKLLSFDQPVTKERITVIADPELALMRSFA